jgi:hypothetical protein
MNEQKEALFSISEAVRTVTYASACIDVKSLKP